MVYTTLHQASPHPDFGGKINGLISLIQAGFLVPKGFIVTNQNLQDLLANNENDWISHLSQQIDAQKTYIVRSSAFLEDGSQSSFAGQYQSIGNCQGKEQILQAIKTCLQANQNAKVEAYSKDHHVTTEQEAFALLIQEQVDADFSGVSFVCHPTKSQDQLWHLEYINGLGEELVSGQKTPYAFSAHWQETISTSSEQALSSQELRQIRSLTLAISKEARKPIDVEFSISNGRIFLLQARPMTRLSQRSELGPWTTANYRDGGVAAQACPHLMWSLYRSSWQASLEEFLLTQQLLKKEQLASLIKLQYARPYWNLGLVKAAMERIPGYIEQEFDDELGLEKNYQGSGYKSRLTARSIKHLLRVALAISRSTKQWMADNKNKKEKILRRYQELENELLADLSRENIETIWLKLVEEDYLQAEKSYFWQVFINTVQLSLKKNQLLKELTLDEFFTLIADLGQISHLKPMDDLQKMVLLLQSDSALLDEWKHSSVEELVQKLHQDRKDMIQLRFFLKKFGYHSARELNLLEPSFSENPAFIVRQVQQILDQAPATPHEQTDFTKEIQDRLGHRKWKKIQKDIRFLRDLLWWREEWKDISTRYYHLIRQWTLKLAKAYQAETWLEDSDDLFYCKWEEIKKHIQGQLSPQELESHIQNNRLYCEIFAHAPIPGELFDKGQVYKEEKTSHHQILYGLSASSGLVRGPIRVLDHLDQLHEVKAGEILVTRFTDTGWTPVFGRIAGLVTETGGVLCHASIVAREYGIPALVCVKGARERVETGMMASLNSYENCLIIEKKENEKR